MNKLVKPIIPYGMVPNKLLNNPEVSFKAKGLFCFIQSKPDGWNFSIDKISFQSKESKSSISEGLKELEKQGYLKREKKQSAGGFTTKYFLYFKSILEKPMSDFRTLENPSLEKPTLEKPSIGKSVNNSKKELSNKEYSNKEREDFALSFLEINHPSEYERLMMQFRKQINNYEKFSQMFEATVEQEKLEFDLSVLSGRFKKYALNWVSNQNKFDAPVIELNATQRKEKIGGF